MPNRSIHSKSGAILYTPTKDEQDLYDQQQKVEKLEAENNELLNRLNSIETLIENLTNTSIPATTTSEIEPTVKKRTRKSKSSTVE